MRWLQLVARLSGRLGYFFVAFADRVDPQWDPVPIRLLGAYEGELDELLSAQNTPTLPPPPRVPRADGGGDRQCRPPAIPKGERRVIYIDGKRESVTPGPGTFWQGGGSS